MGQGAVNVLNSQGIDVLRGCSGDVKAVVITGGMARSKLLVGMIRKYAGFVAPFVVYPEVEEMIGVVRRIRDQGVSVLVIEHVMRVIMSLCDRIVP